MPYKATTAARALAQQVFDKIRFAVVRYNCGGDWDTVVEELQTARRLLGGACDEEFACAAFTLMLMANEYGGHDPLCGSEHMRVKLACLSVVRDRLLCTPILGTQRKKSEENFDILNELYDIELHDSVKFVPRLRVVLPIIVDREHMSNAQKGVSRSLQALVDCPYLTEEDKKLLSGSEDGMWRAAPESGVPFFEPYFSRYRGCTLQGWAAMRAARNATGDKDKIEEMPAPSALKLLVKIQRDLVLISDLIEPILAAMRENGRAPSLYVGVPVAVGRMVLAAPEQPTEEVQEVVAPTVSASAPAAVPPQLSECQAAAELHPVMSAAPTGVLRYNAVL